MESRAGINATRRTLSRYARVARNQLPELILDFVILLVLFQVGLGAASWFKVEASAYAAQAIPTFFAVIGTIPFAVWGFRLEASVRRDEEAQQQAGPRRMTLEVVRDELQEAMSALRARGEGTERPPYLVPSIKTQAWEALSQGGDLGIDDPSLIANIARAYHALATTNDLERMLMHTEHYNEGSPSNPRPRLFRKRWDALIDQDERSVTAVQTALSRVGTALS